MLPHMAFREQCEAAKAQSPHWTPKMRNHLRRLMRRDDVTFAIWMSDAHGRPANHAMDPIAARAWTARPGLVQTVAGPLEACSGRALHATRTPHRWKGCRAWLVALVGEVIDEGDKLVALRREIVGEMMPENAIDPSVGVRIGRIDLVGASLDGASLARANLARANLAGANLDGANLDGASWPKSRPAPAGWTHDPPVAGREWVVLRRA